MYLVNTGYFRYPCQVDSAKTSTSLSDLLFTFFIVDSFCIYEVIRLRFDV